MNQILEVKKLTKLNLGCGKDYRKGYFNIDMDEQTNADLILDLSKHPFPILSNSINEILAFNFLEHVNNYDFIIKEMYRVCKPNALIKVIVPHFSSANAFLDDNKRFFNIQAFLKYRNGTGKDTAYYPKEFFPDNKQKLLNESDSAGFERKEYFKITKISLSFAHGFNPLNYIAPIFNLSKRLLIIYEGTILKNIFPADFIYFELKVIK